MVTMKNNDPVLAVPASFRKADEVEELLNSEEVRLLRGLLEEDETVYRLVLCYRNDRAAILAATNKRVIYTDHRFILQEVQEFDYGEIVAIIDMPGVSTRTITLVHPARSLTVNNVDMVHGEQFIEYVRHSIGGDYKDEGEHVFSVRDEVLNLDDLPKLKKEVDDALQRRYQ